MSAGGGIGPRLWDAKGHSSRPGELVNGRLPGAETASKSGMRLSRDSGEVSVPGPSGSPSRSGGESSGRPGGQSEHGIGGLTPSESGKSGSEDAPKPQPSDDDGVPEDMATLVLDKAAFHPANQGPFAGNPALGEGSVVRPDPETERLAAERHFAAADPASDAAIMLRVAAGDEAGFNYLVGKYHRAMVHFLFRMVHTQAVAEELAQEVFLRVYRSRESYRAEAKFTTWLYRIATNLAVNHARDTKHERTAQTVYLDVPDEETGTTPEVADDEPTVEQKHAPRRAHGSHSQARDGAAGTAANGGADAQVPGAGLSADRRRAEAERVGDQVAALPRLPDAA